MTINETKATDSDGIPGPQYASTLATSFTKILNNLYRLDSYQANSRKQKLHLPFTRLVTKIYRSISLLPIIIKGLELIISSQLNLS